MNFATWLVESEQETRERLETAVREYVARRPPPERCYYVYDDTNPETELGPDYDRNIKVVRGMHPTAFKCRGVAENLVEFLKDRGFKSRVVAGWYGRTGAGYPRDEIRLDSPIKPGGFPSTKYGARQHWWVEADGFYVDLTSAQFHPMDPANQRDLVIRSKQGAFEDGEYAAVRRMPLGRRAKLPEGILRMIDKISSLKKFMHSTSRRDWYELSQWMKKNAQRYGLDPHRIEDLVASIQGQDFHFWDKSALKKFFSEAFDDMEEDASPEEAQPFTPPQPKRSRGAISYFRNSVTLKTYDGDNIEENFSLLKEIIGRHFPGAEMGEQTKEEYRARNGIVHQITATVRHDKWPNNHEFFRELQREGFSKSKT